ncbi:MAG: hypothetical protein A2V93_05840 [Ignavibacteria bacterium RBG_16_34_14]|nr:MAG: hypothetical protein A2V93_05840 [Ignavibacteria bacterium RBG_16_34_14]
MYRTFNFLFTVVFLLVVSVSALAQEIKYTSGNSNDTRHIYVITDGVLLYDQTGAIGTGTIASQQFSDFATYSCQAADDFVVPASGWNINEIVCLGTAGIAPFTQALVEFYADNGTLPGTVVSTQTASVVDAAGTLSITLSPSVALSAGTYWVSVSVIGDFASFGQWFWATQTTSNNDLWCWQNPGNGFGTGSITYNPHNVAFPAGYVDNDLSFGLYGDVIPVELTSFSASVGIGQVNLNWQTATETNNYGFEVERKAAGQEFAKVGFIAGHGTTTEVKNYNFIDNSVSSGSYTYRLKQVDLDGTFAYSDEVEVDLAPTTYSLAQNFPNPFNPSTKISFSLPVESNVTLKIFNVIGQEVMSLVKGTLNAGSHNLDLNASNLNSGVYFYTLEAQGIDGSSFSEVKKMMLTK